MGQVLTTSGSIRGCNQNRKSPADWSTVSYWRGSDSLKHSGRQRVPLTLLVTGPFLPFVFSREKQRQTACRVSYGTLIWPVFIYNSRTRTRILTKFSEMKRSSIVRLVTKFCVPEVVAMETVTHSFLFFNDRYLSRGWSYCLEILAMCAPKAKVNFMFRTEFPET